MYALVLSISFFRTAWALETQQVIKQPEDEDQGPIQIRRFKAD